MCMKTKIISFPFLLVIAMLVIGACNKKESIKPSYVATLNGANETPPNNSTATGMATLIFDPGTELLSGTITFNGFMTTTTAAHIRNGAAGVLNEYP